MLREVGKRVSTPALCGFLEAHAAKMPRTALRYAIERLPEAERRRWLGVKRQRVATIRRRLRKPRTPLHSRIVRG
jgi:hypothetical protein